MDILKVIRSVEELIYEMCLWFLLVPKTFFRTFKPSWVINYIKTELQKEEKKQFEQFMSPMLLWILTVAVPAFLLIRSFAIGLDNDILKELIGKSLELKIVLVSTFLIISPLTIAVSLQKATKRSITKNDLRENFYIQIYTFIPVQSLSIIGFYGMNENGSSLGGLFSIFYMLLGIVACICWYWFFYCEIYIIKTTINIGLWKSILLFTLFLLMASVFTLVIMLFLLSLLIPDVTNMM